MRRYVLFLALVLVSCAGNTRKGIEGSNNSNNTVVIADKVVMPDTAGRQYRGNFDITTEGVGGVKLGQSIDHIQQFFKTNTNLVTQTEEGAREEAVDYDYPSIDVQDKRKETLFQIRFVGMKVATSFEVYSKDYKTYNGIHVGMSLKELSALYNDNLIIYRDLLHEEDYFQPFDLTGGQGVIYIYVKSTDGKPLGKVDSLYDTKRDNYRMDGVVSYIALADTAHLY